MMHFKSNKSGVADITDFSGSISAKQDGILSLTKLVVVISILFAVLMIVSK